MSDRFVRPHPFPPIVLAGVILLLIGGLSPAAAQDGGYAWQIEVLEAGVDVSGSTNIALNRSGLPAIAYADGARGVARYARWDGAAWQFETVSSGGWAMGPVSLVLDRIDRAHMSFVDAQAGRLKYAERTDIGWRVLDVDEIHFEGYNSLAIDTAGVPHLAYPWDNGKLRHARLQGSMWITETIDPDVVTARDPSLAFDASDRAHVAYYGNGRLNHARWVGYRWTIEVVDNASPRYVNLAIDARDVPKIGYLAENALRYTWWNGTAWVREVIDGDSDGFDARLALDGSGNPHVSYYDRTSGFLRYAHNLGAGWIRHTVDLTYISGWYSAVAVGADGRPHFSYYSWEDRAVRHAVGGFGLGIRTWPARAVTSTSAVLPGELTSLGNATTAEVFVDWRIPGEEWQRARAETLTSPGMILASVEGLEPETAYEFRAGVTTEAGTSYGEIRSFDTPEIPPSAPDLRAAALGAVGVAAGSLVTAFWFWRRRRKRRDRLPDFGAIDARRPCRRRE